MNDTTVTLSRSEMADLRLLAWGAYAPLRGFLKEADYEGVLTSMRLASGSLWPLPVTVAVGAERAGEVSRAIEAKRSLQLRSPAGEPLGTIEEPELYRVEPRREA